MKPWSGEGNAVQLNWKQTDSIRSTSDDSPKILLVVGCKVSGVRCHSHNMSLTKWILFAKGFARTPLWLIDMGMLIMNNIHLALHAHWRVGLCQWCYLTSNGSTNVFSFLFQAWCDSENISSELDRTQGRGQGWVGNNIERKNMIFAARGWDSTLP